MFQTAEIVSFHRFPRYSDLSRLQRIGESLEKNLQLWEVSGMIELKEPRRHCPTCGKLAAANEIDLCGYCGSPLEDI